MGRRSNRGCEAWCREMGGGAVSGSRSREEGRGVVLALDWGLNGEREEVRRGGRRIWWRL
jgi:hypothetical protein